MTLTSLDMLRLRAADGLTTGDDELRLVEAGIDPDEWRHLRASLAQALTPPQVPDLADAVMARLGLDDGLSGDVLRGALDPGPLPDLADAVMAQLGVADDGHAVRFALLDGAGPELADAVLDRLGLDDGTPRVRELLRDQHAQAMAEAPDVTEAVMARLGVEPAQLGQILLDGAGAAPDLWGGIAGELGIDNPEQLDSPEQAAPASQPAGTVTRGPARWWRLPAVGLAAAAALLLTVSGSPESTSSQGLAFQMSDVNSVEIEDVFTDANAIVEVLQFGPDEPTIIYIDVVDDMTDPVGSDGEGATL